MERHLSLIKTEYQELEKRVFPRFPFGFMVFKAEGHHMVFEVKDISLTGMQLAFKDGNPNLKAGDKLVGQLQWRGAKISASAKVHWIRETYIGLSFESSIAFESQMREFLSFDKIVSHIKPLHDSDLAIDLPNNLKYWLRSDGVFDLYVWGHPTNGISRFQILIMEHFIEWEEGVGMRTGKAITQRNLDRPLSSEDEFVFDIDSSVNQDKVDMACGVVKKIQDAHLHTLDRDFILTKLGK